MTYELSKQLKDAGFKSNFVNYCQICGSSTPTLSELIEACGKIVLWSYNGKWYAGNNDKCCCSEFYFDGYPNPLEEGDTPEDAVALLWLQLNK